METHKDVLHQDLKDALEVLKVDQEALVIAQKNVNTSTAHVLELLEQLSCLS